MPESHSAGGSSDSQALAWDAADDDSERLLSSLQHESDDLWKQHRIVAIATLTLPIWLSGLVLLGAVSLGGVSLVRKLVLATAASAAAGRFIIWGGDHSEGMNGFSVSELALLVLLLDTVWAIVVTWHAGVLFHVPWLGERLKAAVQEGSGLLKRNRWMKRLTVGAVLLFVMLPISSTGSIGGSLLGRLLGLSRSATLVTVLLGSIFGCGVMLVGAHALKPVFQGISPTLQYAAIAGVVLFFFVLSKRYRRFTAD